MPTVPAFLPIAVGTRFVGKLYINSAVGQGQGWTETYHLQAASYNEALVDLGLLWTARKATLCTDCFCRYGYVSDMAIKGDSLALDLVTLGSSGTYGAHGETTMQNWNIVFTRFESTALYHTFRPIHGIPSDQQLSLNGPAGAYRTALLSYMDQIKAVCFNFVKQKPNDPAPMGNFRVITDRFILGFDEHRVGRPTGLQRGQRRKKKKRAV